MRALLSVLLVSPAVAGTPIMDAHPIVTLLQSHEGLRSAVPGAIQALGAPGGVEAALAELSPAQQVALGMAAYREDVPAGAVSESLGKRGPEAVAALATLRLTEPQTQKIRAQLSLDTAEGSAGLYAAVRAIYETDPTLPGLVKETLLVEGKAGKGAAPLAPSERFVAESEKSIEDAGVRVESGRYGAYAAARLHASGGVLTAVDVGTARSWEEARAKARALGPAWDLPDEVEAQSLVLTRTIAAPRVMYEGEKGHYLVWGRYPDEEMNEKLVDGIATFGVRHSDGEVELVDFEPGEMDQIVAGLAKTRGRPYEGLPVYAVQREAKPPAPSPVEKKTLH
jgi:hypothetical protein